MKLYSKCKNNNNFSSFVGLKIANEAYKNSMLANKSSFIKTYSYNSFQKDLYGSRTNLMRNGRMANELLIPHLFWQCGLNAVEYFPWKMPKQENTQQPNNGLSSKNALEQDEKFLHLTGLRSIPEVIAYLNTFNSVSKDMLKDIEQKLFVLSIVDFLTLQSDRNAGNMPISVNKSLTIRFAKVFDNEYAFCCEHFGSPRFIENSGIKKDEVNIDYVISEFNKDLKTGICTNFAPNASSTTLNATYKDVAESIANYATEHPHLLPVLYRTMENLDISKAANCLAAKGIEICPQYISYCNAIVNSGKMQILQELENTTKNEK